MRRLPDCICRAIPAAREAIESTIRSDRASATDRERIAWAMAHVGVRGGKHAVETLAGGQSAVAPVARMAIERMAPAASDDVSARSPGREVTVNRAFSRRFFEALERGLPELGKGELAALDASSPMELLDDSDRGRAVRNIEHRATRSAVGGQIDGDDSVAGPKERIDEMAHPAGLKLPPVDEGDSGELFLSPLVHGQQDGLPSWVRRDFEDLTMRDAAHPCAAEDGQIARGGVARLRGAEGVNGGIGEGEERGRKHRGDAIIQYAFLAIPCFFLPFFPFS